MEVGGKISGFIDGFLGKENVEAFNNLGNKNVEGSKNVGKLPGGQDAKTMQVTGRLKQIGIVAASVLAGIVTFGAGAAIAFEALVKIATPNNEGGKPTDQASAKAEIKGQEILGASSVQKQNSTEDPRK